MGSLLGSDVAVAFGAVVGGVAGVVLAKGWFESDSSLAAQALLLGRQADLSTRLADRQADLGHRIDRFRADLSSLERNLSEHADGLARLETSSTNYHETMTMAVTDTRSLLDKLARQVPSPGGMAERLRRLALPDVPEPMLSIAIPSFNRPTMLETCLASLEEEIGQRTDNVVEVCITDDASTDPDTIEVAASFCERVRFGSLRRHPTNIGLDRNLISACAPCRGKYVLVLGNDDVLVTGAIRTILDDLRGSHAPIHLYEKTRINRDGTRRPPVPGSSPVEVGRGEEHRFRTMFDAARKQGYLSTFGFVSQVVFCREPFAGIDAEPYLGLTMYPQVFVLLEAFGSQPVHYRNSTIVLHRTPTAAQKRAEGLGRREEVFMFGGVPKQTRYFGTTLAASWQRLIDRTGVDHALIINAVERLMTPKTLVDWMICNRAADRELDGRLDSVVVGDAERLFRSIAARSERSPGDRPRANAE